MANSQDATDGDSYGFDPGGEVTTAWGGQMSTPIDSIYKGGYDYSSGVGVPLDPAAYEAAKAKAFGSSGRSSDVDRYRQMGAAGANTAAPTLNYGDANRYLGGATTNLNEGAGYRRMGAEDRDQQMAAVAAAQGAALGNAPSQAQLLGQGMIDSSLQAQLAGAAGARGGTMAQAAAMRQASQGAGAMQAQGTQQLAAMRAQEMATARDQWLQGTTGMRGQDYTASGQATQAAGQYAQMGQTAANMAQIQGSLDMQQRTLNQNNQQFYEGQAFNVNQAALNAGLGRAGSMQQQDQFNKQMEMQQQQQTQQAIAAGLGATATVGAAAVAKRASGGPIAPGQPVLVGEQGPEVIVPQGRGMVLPAHHPASMTMAQVAKLRAQADEMERAMHANLARGPAVGGQPQQRPQTFTAAPVIIDDAPQERLYGGREDPYTPNPYYVPTDAAPPTMGASLGTREDPYASPMARAARAE